MIFTIFLCWLQMGNCGKLSSLLQKFYSLQVYFDVIEEIDCIIDKHVCMTCYDLCSSNL